MDVSEAVAAIHRATREIGAEATLAKSVLVERSAIAVATVFAEEIAWAGPSRILEIGTWHGASAALLALLAPAARVVTIDKRGPSLEALELWHALGLSARIDGVIGRSSTSPAASFGVVFIDADHTPCGVAADVVAVRSRLAPRASIVFDDVHHHQGGGTVVWTLPGARDAGRLGVVRVEHDGRAPLEAVEAAWPSGWLT